MGEQETTSIPLWLDKEFLEQALQLQEKDTDLQVISFMVRRATSTGDNYMSELYRTTLKVRSGDKSSERTVSLIVKCSSRLPSLKKLVSDLGIFERERQMYQVILPEINRLLSKSFQSENQPFAPKCVYGDFTSNEPILLLEDLVEQGFKMAERRDRLDFTHSLYVLKSLAKYHAATVALYDTNPSYFRVFLNRVGSESEEMRRIWMDEYFAGVLRSLADKTEAWPEVPASYATRLRNLADNIVGRLFQVTERDDAELNVLTHGDMWINNVMFQYGDSDRQIESIRFLDFQLTHWTSPAMDLLYFLYTSPREELLDQHDALIEVYHHELEAALLKLGLGHKSPSLQNLYQQLDKRDFYAVFVSSAVLPLVLTNPSHAIDMNDIFEKDVQGGIGNSKLHDGVAYMVTMRKMLSSFDKKGFF